MAGLIEEQVDLTKQKPLDPIDPSSPTLTEAKAFGYQPQDRTVNPATETTSGQLDTILSKDSPVLQRARAGAMERANSRGLINSTMAAQAGEAAVIDAATPIAAQDANTFTQVGTQNKLAQDQALSQGATALNTVGQTNAANANTMTLQGVKGGQAQQLALIEANYKTLIQTSDAAAKMFNQSQATIASIMSDPNTSAFQKQAAVDQVALLLESGLTVVGGMGNVDVKSLLDFSGGTGGSAVGGTGGATGNTGRSPFILSPPAGANASQGPINPRPDDPSNAPYMPYLQALQGLIAEPPPGPDDAQGDGQIHWRKDADISQVFSADPNVSGKSYNPYMTTANADQLRGYAVQLGLQAWDADRAALQYVTDRLENTHHRLYDKNYDSPQVVADGIAKIISANAQEKKGG